MASSTCCHAAQNNSDTVPTTARAHARETQGATEDERGVAACASESKAGTSDGTTAAKRARTSSYSNTAEPSLDHSADEDIREEEHKGSHPRRWSSEEDERLRASVEKHQGAKWKEIAKGVKSRNHVQCLQRWKKVLAPGLVKGQWTAEEDKILVSLVNEGHKNWGTLSAWIPGRTSKQCRERWCHHLDPRVVKCGWTAAEDDMIVSMHQRIGNKWAQIARHLDGRTENATKTRWKMLEREMTREEHDRREDGVSSGERSPWGTGRWVGFRHEEEEAGCWKDPAAVRGDHGESSDDAMGLPNPLPATHDPKGKRVAHDRRVLQGGHLQQPPSNAAGVDGERWSGDKGQDRHDTVRRRWLAEEDERLKEAVEELGEKHWREVALKVRTRDRVQCQQRWRKALRPGLVKGAWSGEEDEKLIALMSQGFKSWSKLAANTRRTAKQCRERWTHHLDPNLRHVGWTPEEDRLLITLEGRLGKKWAAIAREIPGRTEHAVKGRFKTLSREKGAGRLVGWPERRAPGHWPAHRHPASSNPAKGHQTPGSTSPGERRGILRIVSSIGVVSTETSTPPRDGNDVANGAGGRAAERGSDLGQEDRENAAAAAAGAVTFVGQTTRRQQHREVRLQQQIVANAQDVLNPNLGAQLPTTTAFSAPSAAIAAPPVPVPNMTTGAASDGDEASIARLLSVSSVMTNVSVSEVTSGCCGRNTATRSSGSGSGKSSPTSSSSSDKSSPGRNQSPVEPGVPGSEVGAVESPQVLPVHELSPTVFDAHISDSVGEGSSLINGIDDAELASVLMDEDMDPCKKEVEPESEVVTLGDDPYVDYAFSAHEHIITGHPSVDIPRSPQEPTPPQQMVEEYASFHGSPVDDMVGTSSLTWTDFLAGSLFGGEDASHYI